MGGLGSGRVRGYQRAATVEECLGLDMLVLTRAGVVGPDVHETRTVRWGHDAVEVTVMTGRDHGEATLDYRARRDDDWQPVRQHMFLETTQEGRHWWWTCPGLGPDGEPCRRRSRIIYLPPRADRFGCRVCQGLQFRSNQSKGTLTAEQIGLRLIRRELVRAKRLGVDSVKTNFLLREVENEIEAVQGHQRPPRRREQALSGA